MKQTFTIKKLINPDIKAGDKIMVIDGSSFTPLNHVDEEYYIIYAHPELTGSDEVIKDIVGEVIYTGIKNSICVGCLGTAYQQDVVIQLGTGLFRSCSKLLRKLS